MDNGKFKMENEFGSSEARRFGSSANINGEWIMENCFKKIRGLEDKKVSLLKKSGELRVKRIPGRHLCRIATKLSRLSVAHQAKFSERGGNPRQSEELSKAVLNNIYQNSLCKGPLTTHNSLLTNKKAAFTLAEVLITLGIIGVVAAMTMPALIQNHRKQVTVSKLKKAATTIMQIHQRAGADYDDNGSPIMNREPFSDNDPDSAMEMFQKYYEPYAKFVKVEKGKRGVLAYFADGTGLYFYKRCTNVQPWGCVFHLVCLKNDICEEIDTMIDTTEYSDKELAVVDGKNVFAIHTNGISNRTNSLLLNKDRDTLITECKNRTNSLACTELIFISGWHIPDDYPIRF